MSDSTWYYTENKQKVGPVPLDELKDKCRLGELGSDDLVWAEGWESWKKVCDVAELASLEPPPLPPEEPPPLPAEVLPENWVLLTNDYQLKKLLEGTGIWSWLPASIFDKNRVIKEIREKLRAKKKYGLVVEPAKEGAYQLRGVFGGRRMFDFRSVPSHVDTPEPVQSTKESLQMKDTNINQPLAQLGGIGGWLYLVGLGVILSPFRLVKNI